MSDVTASGQLKQMVVEAVVIRADGTREDLGVISYWHKNPLKRFWFEVKKFFRR
jgi:hypothetical protein